MDKGIPVKCAICGWIGLSASIHECTGVDDTWGYININPKITAMIERIENKIDLILEKLK